MVNVRDVIEDAFAAIGYLDDGSHVDGDQAAVGERFLNQLIATLNLQDFFAFQRTTLDFTVPTTKAHFLIGPAQPAGEVQPDIEAQRPSNVTSVFIGTRSDTIATEIIRVAQADMPGFAVESAQGLPGRVTYISSYPLGELWFDMKIKAGYVLRLCFSRTLPEMHLNDELPIPFEYQGALTWGLADLLTARYPTTPDVKATIADKIKLFFGPIRVNTTVKTPVQAFVGGAVNNILTRN